MKKLISFEGLGMPRVMFQGYARVFFHRITYIKESKISSSRPVWYIQTTYQVLLPGNFPSCKIRYNHPNKPLQKIARMFEKKIRNSYLSQKNQASAPQPAVHDLHLILHGIVRIACQDVGIHMILVGIWGHSWGWKNPQMPHLPKKEPALLRDHGD